MSLISTKYISIFDLKYLVMFKGINAIEFTKRFQNNEDCYNYLIDIKWRIGYQCSRCGCQQSIKAELIITEDVAIVVMMKA